MKPLLLLSLLGATVVPHNAPEAVPAVPEGGFDLRAYDQLQALASRISRHVLRVDVERDLPEPFDPAYPAREDGAAVLLAPGRAVTAAAYLLGARRVQVTLPSGAQVDARIEALLGATPEAGDFDLRVAVLSFATPPDGLAEPVPGFVSFFAGAEGALAPGEVVLPLSIGGGVPSVRVGAIHRVADETLVSGVVANGVPAFDAFGRVVALAVRPSPDRSRTVVVDGGTVARLLGP